MKRRQREAVFRQWMADHQGMLRRTAAGFAPPADRDDLLQEMMIAVWHALPAFRADSSPGTFIYRVVHNCALTWHRGRRRRPSLIPIDEHAGHSSSQPPDEDAVALHQAVAELPEVDRTLVLLHLEGLTYDEIAEVVGITATNVGARLTRLRQRLAAFLNPQPTTENER